MDTTKRELMQEFGTAIVNLVLDAVEDAGDDLANDLETIEINGEGQEQPEPMSEAEKLALTMELAAIVAAKLMVRLQNANDWAALRAEYPRSLLL